MAIANAVCDQYDKHMGSNTALESPKLKKAESILKLSKALGSKFLHFYVYGAVEGNVLVLYLSHPALLMEFKGQKVRVLEEMRAIYKKENLKDILSFRDVRVAVKSKPMPKKEKDEPYLERATGDFEIHCEYGELKRAFERLRETIRKGQNV